MFWSHLSQYQNCAWNGLNLVCTPSKHETLRQCCLNVGPQSVTETPNDVSMFAHRLRRWANIETAILYRVFWGDADPT